MSPIKTERKHAKFSHARQQRTLNENIVSRNKMLRLFRTVTVSVESDISVYHVSSFLKLANLMLLQLIKGVLQQLGTKCLSLSKEHVHRVLNIYLRITNGKCLILNQSDRYEGILVMMHPATSKKLRRKS
ncbi:hypothetical protein AMECASPLE_014556 [Ameca splendens]|uniref:Uncharacterized protein n=1 Tax=Ameca splendens TaxID=208324 RepID=A0ABV0ZP43_9TELE